MRTILILFACIIALSPAAVSSAASPDASSAVSTDGSPTVSPTGPPSVSPTGSPSVSPTGPPSVSSAISPDTDLACIRQAYPGAVAAIEDGPNGPVLVFAGGRKLAYDDGRLKTAQEALDSPSVKDMMEQPYPLGASGRDPAPDFHPGRRRVTAFFQELYGQDAADVKSRLVTVNFAGKRLRFASGHGAAQALEAAGEEIKDLLARRPDLKRYVFPASTFAWRTIAGEDRLSMHSFGIAVDLNPRLGSYWGWSPPGAPTPAPSYPLEIVEIFEKHGFIWGGKWREFDLMHFEYRPELVCKAKAETKAVPEAKN